MCGIKKDYQEYSIYIHQRESCLHNLIAFYDGMTGFVDEERAAGVVYLDFSKAFETLSHNILIAQEVWIR